ncbi:MAG: LacI family transcriptional regulator [Lachnospiraceae bacterium]|nr:LacI family transcriptional regulator [Lachnospiraceae bacterium]
MATIKDVAKAAGTSIGTVSRAFNGYPDINTETKARIFSVANQLGYSPNINAKSLSSKVSRNMGLIVSGFLESDARNGFVLSLLKGTYRYAYEQNLEVALYTLDAEQQKTKSYEQFCTEHSIFGAVLSGVATNDVYFNQLVKAGLPCVLIDVYIKGEGLGCVSIDNVKAAEEMTNYLLDANHRKIVVVQGKKQTEVNSYRIAGIYAAMQKRGMELCRDNIINGEFREHIAYEATKQYIREHGKESATAFMCLSDVMALGVMRAITDMGYSVPDDFSVTGFDGIPVAGYTTPGLTTIEQDMEKIGYHAARVLLDLTRNPTQSRNVYVAYEFIERNSVKKR